MNCSPHLPLPKCSDREIDDGQGDQELKKVQEGQGYSLKGDVIDSVPPYISGRFFQKVVPEAGYRQNAEVKVVALVLPQEVAVVNEVIDKFVEADQEYPSRKQVQGFLS